MTFDIKKIEHDDRAFKSLSSLYFEMAGDGTCTYPTLQIEIEYTNVNKPTLLIRRVSREIFVPIDKFIKYNRGVDYELFDVQLGSYLQNNPLGVELHNRDVYYTDKYKAAFSAK